MPNEVLVFKMDDKPVATRESPGESTTVRRDRSGRRTNFQWNVVNFRCRLINERIRIEDIIAVFQQRKPDFSPNAKALNVFLGKCEHWATQLSPSIGISSEAFSVFSVLRGAAATQKLVEYNNYHFTPYYAWRGPKWSKVGESRMRRPLMISSHSQGSQGSFPLLEVFIREFMLFQLSLSMTMS